MKLTERYIGEVRRRLPENKREDAEKNVRALIHERTEEKGGYSEEVEKEVLNEIGNPKIFADKYLGRKRYLIGPELFYVYLPVMKILVIITVILAAVGIVIESVTEHHGFLESFVNILNGIISAGLGAFALVTVIFAMIEYNSKTEDIAKINIGWTVKNLPGEGRRLQKAFNKAGITAGIIVNIILIFLVNNYYGAVGAYYTGAEGLRFIPALNTGVFSAYLPYINMVLIAQILVQFNKLIFSSWNFPLAGINMLVNILSAALFITILGNESLINANFISEMSRLSGQTKEALNSAYTTIRNVMYVIVAISTAADSAEGFWKAYKAGEEKCL